jgi:hypothetical protein
MRDPHVDDIRWLYRTTFAKKIVDKPIEDAFKNDYEIVDDGGLDTNAELVLDDTDFITHYKIAEKKARRDGFALLFYVLEDTGGGVHTDPLAESVTVTDFQGINVLTLDDLTYSTGSGIHDKIPLDHDDYHIRETGIVIDTRVNEPTYEEPIGYLVGPDDYPRNDTRADFVHANRVQHLTWNPEVDGDLSQSALGRYEGDSVLASTYHLLRGLKKGNWSIMQTLFRYAAKLYHVELPEDADEDDMEEASEMMRNLNSMSELLTPAGYEIESHGTDGQLDPEEYFNVIFEQVCASTEMTKSVLFGTQSGTVSGSQTDIKNYFNKVERYRQTRAERHIQRFVAMHRGYMDNRVTSFDVPTFEFEWPPMFRLSELEQAEEHSRTVTALKSAIDSFVLTPSEARELLAEEWAALELDELSDEEVEFLESLNLHQQGAEPAAEKAAAEAGNPLVGQNGGGMEQGQSTAATNPTTE